jgi:subtilase family serine protease
MNLANERIKHLTILAPIVLAILFVSPTFANSGGVKTTVSTPVSHMASTNSVLTLLDKGFNPATGGLPFCHSGSLGSIICYTPSFLKTAYNFPSGEGAPDGTGATIVLVDAYGSPTIVNDLATFNNTFNITPHPDFTIVCQDGLPSPGNAPCINWHNPPHPECQPLGWAGETTLDVDMSIGLAPGAHIVLVEANSCYDSDLYTAEMNVVNNPDYAGSIMSQSFGEPDDLVTCLAVNANNQCVLYDNSILNNCDPTNIYYIGCPNVVFQDAYNNGWTVIASTGDDGANEDQTVLGTSELTPGFPSTSPLVLAAGGTEGYPYGGKYGGPPGPGGSNFCLPNQKCNTGLVVINGGASGCSTATRPGVPTSCYPTGYGGEQTWNEFNTFGIRTSSGGGVSMLYSRPSWQSRIPTSVTTLLGNRVRLTGLYGGRATPDVSFNAAIDGGFLAFLGYEGLSGTWGVFGGTSAASPAWAGIIAVLDDAKGGPVGFVNAEIYQIGSGPAGAHAFHDISHGENSDTQGAPCNYAFCFNLGAPVDGYTSVLKYDLATGWGTPNVANFIAAYPSLP